MTLRPTGSHFDVVVTGTDGRPYRASADSPTGLLQASWASLGDPPDETLEVAYQGWLADRSDFVVVAKGSDAKAMS